MMKKKMKMGGAAPKKAMMGNTMMANPMMEKPMMKMGGSLKSVDKGKNPGLAKLPTPVRNKMGYKKYGGAVDMMKAQTGKSVKPTADSTAYFKKERDMEYADADRNIAMSKKDKSSYDYSDYTKARLTAARKADKSADRQLLKGKPGYDENGYSLNRFKPESLKQQIAKGFMKKKMQAGGVVKTQPKRMGPIDPNGAYTKVQERTLAGKKVAAPKLTKDKELGATKMKKGGKVSKKK